MIKNSIENIIDKDPTNFYMVGVVPVAGKPLDFQFHWHDCMMPVARDLLAVELAVMECIEAACKGVWIVCHEDMQPLIKHRLGISMKNLSVWRRIRYAGKAFGLFKRNSEDVPIYYIPIHPRDLKKRDSLGWSVLYGVKIIWDVALTISKYSVPPRYYVSFPYGITDLEFIKKAKKKFRIHENVLFSYDGKTVLDGEYLSFTISTRQIKELIGYAKKEKRRLPLDETFSLIDSDKKLVVDVPWFYSIGSWEEYKKYIGSEESALIERNYIIFSKGGAERKRQEWL